MRNGILLLALFSLVLLVNSSVLSFNLMYAEQPMLYAANQTVQSWWDLLNIYLQPKMLDVFSVPFFRPSGHFLMYYFLMPVLGWHNTQGLIAVNLFFLALTGLVLVKLYELLFPGFKVGGYLAFGIYLMHPALMLARLIVLHFEFAYVFFTLLSLYCFALFCRQITGGQPALARTTGYPLLLAALFFYIFAVTFKEPALMLGPVMAVYLILSCYHGESSGKYLSTLARNKPVMQILALLTVVSLSAALYLSLAWPSLAHPLGSLISGRQKIAASAELVKMLFGFSGAAASREALAQPNLIWRELIFTPSSRLLLWPLFLLTLVVTLNKLGFSRLQGRGPAEREALLAVKKALLFLGVSALLFMILPVNWAMGLPWHLSLTLIFVSLMAGFAFEDLGRRFIKNKKTVAVFALLLGLLLGLATVSVNRANLAHLQSRNGFALMLARNAVLHPPALSVPLKADTVLVVADSLLHDSYALGNSGYPLFLRTELNFDELQKVQAFSFLKYQAIYNGYLFKWAYLMPGLQEEVYPFDVNELRTVPDAVIHNWLQHYDNIVCLGYDRQANWQDRTAQFKHNLLAEKAKRLLIVHQYEPRAATSLNGRIMYTRALSLPDHQICQYECDQNVQCKGFTYQNAEYRYRSVIKCQYYEAIPRQEEKFCATCIGFIKNV